MDCHHALCLLQRNGSWSESLGSTLASYEGVDQLMLTSLYLLGCGVNWFNGCKYSTQKSDQALKLYVCLNYSLSRNSLTAPWQSIHNRFTLILLAIHCFPQKIKQIIEGNHSLKRSEHAKQNRELSPLIKSLRYSCENPKYDLLTPQIQKKSLFPLFVNSSNGQMPSVYQRDMEIWRQHSSAGGKLLFYQTTSVSIIDSKTNNTPTETLLGWV